MAPPADGPPRISMLNWVLGGSLVTVPKHHKKRVTSTTSKMPPIEEVKEAETKNEAGEKKRDAEKSEKKDSSEKPAWTAERDALLIKLKAEGKPWKEILPLVKTSKKEAQARFKEILGTDAESGDEKREEKHDEKKKEDAEKDGKREGRLKPDNTWTKEDCEMLEMLEARYREQKWLQLQAAFYNMTGRMVRGEFIEQKFKTG